MLKSLKYIIYFFCGYIAYGQQIEISGTVKSNDGGFVPHANVVINNTSSSENINYGYTDEKGSFSIEIPSEIQTITINVSAIGYQEKTVFIQLNNNYNIEIYLEERVTQLQEVIVEVKKNEDILDLDINNMSLRKESTLREILDKTEGIIMGEEGTISYQGKQINKILINSKEVFINQNKVALDNLDYEIMDKVQIIDNYKDKFTLDFDRIRDPVINIDTKSEFKGILKTEVSVGYGFKNKYSLLGKGFFFSDEFNSFVTTHTNNTGKKEFSQQDVLSSVTNYATTTLEKTFQSFFIDNVQTKKNFVSNSNLTFRWQGDKSKTGIVVYHGNIHTEQEINYNTFIADTLIEKSYSENIEKGNFVSATANYNYFISSSTVLQNNLNALIVKSKKNEVSMDTLLIPDQNYFMQQNLNTPKDIAISNVMKLTHMLGDSAIFDLDMDYYYENFSRDYKTQLSNIEAPDIFQEESFSKSFFSTQGNFKFRLEKSALNIGINSTNNIELGKLYSRSNSNNTDLKRNVSTIGIPFYLSGGIKKFDYKISISPTLIFKEQSGNRRFLKMSHSLTYNIESQNKLGLGYSHNYKFYNLNSLYDTIVKDYNHIIINQNESNLEKFSTNDELALSWFNNNVARSKSLHIIYRYNRKQDFLQSVLDSISNNRFFYSNLIFDNKQTHTLNTGAKKGFYVGKVYHRLTIGGNFNLKYSSYPTIVNNVKALAEVNSWNPEAKITFAPRNFFMSEMGNRFEWSELSFNLDGKETNRQSVFTNTFSIKGFGDKVSWNLDFIYRKYNTNDEIFDVPDTHLEFKYDLSEKLSFSIKGQSLLTLFNLNNYSFINTVSDGNTVIQTKTSNNLGYLILYASIKF